MTLHLLEYYFFFFFCVSHTVEFIFKKVLFIVWEKSCLRFLIGKASFLHCVLS